MDAVDASVACRKSVKINNNGSKSFRSEFDSSVYSGKSFPSKKQCKKFVRIDNDSSINFNTITSKVFRYVSQNGTVLKFTKLDEENDVDTNSTSSTSKKKLTYSSRTEKLFKQINTQKTESLQCSNISLSSQNRRKIVTMLDDDVKPKDDGSVRYKQLNLGMAKKKEIKKNHKDFTVNNSKIETITKYRNVNSEKYDKNTARKPIIIEKDINLALIRSKELPNKVFHSKKLLTKESNNNTIKNINLPMSPGRLECNGISLNRKSVGKERNNLKKEFGEVSKKSTNVGFTCQSNETTININNFENKGESNNNKKSSPRKLLIPSLTIKTKECKKFLNMDKMELEINNTSINKQETANELSPANSVEKYAKQDTTSESLLLDLSLPNCTIASQLKSSQINSENDKNENLQETTLIIERSIVSYSKHQNVNIKVLESNEEYVDNCFKNVCITHTGTRPFNIMSVLRNQLKLGRNVADNKSNRCHDIETSDDKTLEINSSKVPKLSPLRSEKHKIIRPESSLIKPSEIIKEIIKNQDLFNNIEYFSAKFQKEVYFLDSFIESIQSLDTTTVEICSTNDISTSTINSDLIEDKIISKNQTNCYTDNLAINPLKRICWLNLFIGDEYKRAKNLLFILKLREDALKDFSRSQIIFLESKKKNDYTNVCMLKKKQRGVLLKLQQECGEMHRIKKILLDITEKRNAIVLQNKSNIEDKLLKSCNVEVKFNNKNIVQRLQSEKNRSPRHCSPLKCFNISGMSYTDDSTELKQIKCNKSFNNIFHINASIKYSSVEKSDKSEIKESYTVGSIENKCQDKDFMLVDGIYLNILFKKLNLPQIFSHGKEYDVHSAALQGLVSSVNRLFECNKTTMELYKDNADMTFSTKLIESTSSKNSSPSTARSLEEEFGDLYESFTETNDSFTKNSIGSIAPKEGSVEKVEMFNILDTQTSVIENIISKKSDVKDHESSTEVHNSEQKENFDLSSNNALPINEKHSVENNVETAFSNYCVLHSDDHNIEEHIQDHSRQGYELPVRPCNENIHIYVDNASKYDESSYDQQNLNDRNFEDVLASPNMSVYVKNDMADCQTCPESRIDIEEDGTEVNNPENFKESVSEAEALRMKQLAIELEVSTWDSKIKALEQQQSQLAYCIREIPDKPPPPYTPPTPEIISNGDKTTVLSMFDKFISKEVIEEHVNQFYREICKEEAVYDLSTNQITEEGKSVVHETVDMCHEFIRDYCKESINKFKTVKSDCPWDCGNILPIKLSKSQSEVKSIITTDICDILVYNPEEDIPKSIQELQMKRYDYIEEILFVEWKKCEKEWTCLENNEIFVKNQLVDGIINKELDEMLDEYLQLVSYSE